MPLNNYDEIRRAYIAACNAGDAEAMAEIFTEDCVVAPPEQPTGTGKAGVKYFYGTHFAAYNVVLSIQTEEEVVLDGWGYWRGSWKARVTPKPGGDAEEVAGKYLNIMKRAPDGGWKIHRQIWNTPTPLVLHTT